jgi:hypothetical protein
MAPVVEFVSQRHSTAMTLPGLGPRRDPADTKLCLSAYAGVI